MSIEILDVKWDGNLLSDRTRKCECTIGLLGGLLKTSLPFNYSYDTRQVDFKLRWALERISINEPRQNDKLHEHYKNFYAELENHINFILKDWCKHNS